MSTNGKHSEAINIVDTSVYYGSKPAVRHVTMPIYQQKITAFIGPSGCGKSTLLRVMNRMNDLVPTARVQGEVLFHGENLYEENIDPVEVRRRIGMVFQKPNPFPKSIFDNVAYGPRVLGVSDKDALQHIVEHSLKQAALWDEVKNDLGRSGLALSGGQQQRLCIARTLAVEPEVILMDEPASALDPIATQRIEELMRELQKEYTIVIVTHNMQQATRASDYTAFLNIRKEFVPDGSSLQDAEKRAQELEMAAGTAVLHTQGQEYRWGELIEFGPTAQIFEAPAQEETKDYISGRFG